MVDVRFAQDSNASVVTTPLAVLLLLKDPNVKADLAGLLRGHRASAATSLLGARRFRRGTRGTAGEARLCRPCQTCEQQSVDFCPHSAPPFRYELAGASISLTWPSVTLSCSGDVATGTVTWRH